MQNKERNIRKELPVLSGTCPRRRRIQCHTQVMAFVADGLLSVPHTQQNTV